MPWKTTALPAAPGHVISHAKTDKVGFEPLPWSWLVVPALLAVATVLVSETTDIDRALTRLAFNPDSRVFPLRSNFWLDVVMHHWAKYLMVALGGLIAAGYALSFFLPALRGLRSLLIFLLLAVSLAPLSVMVAKSLSERHCPWSFEEFGGAISYIRPFHPLPPGVEPGHCFPAGHASTGFALMALYFGAYARGRRRMARVGLACAIAIGLLLGIGRLLQGAHFASHVIWSGILCWTVMLLLYQLLLARSPEGARQLNALF